MLHLFDLAVTEQAGAARTHAREHRALPRRYLDRTKPGTEPGVAAGLPPLHEGAMLGDRYRVNALIGQGGMGAVYRAHDLVLDEEVALKIVFGAGADLRDEVRIAQQIAHRNVCRTYDLEEVDGYHLLKMEYIAGETLAEHLERVGALPVARAVAIARSVADGLAAAHARGIVHRDLKPGNVMLDGDRVVLVDFGLAQRAGATELAGTPPYMSPEQLAGAAVDARSDLYSLGCVLFEMLTGVSPFGVGPIADQVLRREAGPPDVRMLRPRVPRTVASAIGALLSIEPAARDRGLELLRTRARRPRLVLAGVAVALLGLVATGWAMRPARGWEPRIAELPQYEENADEPSFSPDGTQIVFSSDRGHRDVWAIYVASVAGGEPHRVSPEGTFCLAGRWARDGRSVLMSCFIGRDRRILRQPLDGGPARDLGDGWAVDDCGDALAVVTPRPTGAVLVLRDRGGHDVELASLADVSSARCDRSGEHIVYLAGPVGHPGYGGDLAVVDRHGNARTLEGVHGADAATFTPDGRSIVFSMQRGSTSSLYEIPVEGGAIRELTPHELDASSPDVASDGKTVIYDRDRTSSPLFELSSGAAVQKTFRFERLSHVLPAGQMLVATKSEAHELSVVAIDPIDFSERTLAAGEALTTSRAGEVVFRDGNDLRLLGAVSLDGTRTRTIATLPAPVLDAADGPDGVHVELDRDGASEAWLVGRDGKASPESVAGLVMPAPAGGWRVIKVAAGLEVTLRFVPPGRPLSEAAFERAAAWGTPVWIDDHDLAYCDLTACHRLDVNTRTDVETTAIERPGNHPLTASSDGKHWYTTSYVGHVTRHLITNFAERPWAQ